MAVAEGHETDEMNRNISNQMESMESNEEYLSLEKVYYNICEPEYTLQYRNRNKLNFSTVEIAEALVGDGYKSFTAISLQRNHLYITFNNRDEYNTLRNEHLVVRGLYMELKTPGTPVLYCICFWRSTRHH